MGEEDTRSEVTEIPVKERRRVRIDNFDARETSEFLPRWNSESIGRGWTFTRELGNTLWRLRIKPGDRKVDIARFSSSQEEVGQCDKEVIGGIGEVEMDYQNGKLSFRHHSGEGGLTISDNGMELDIVSPDGQISRALTITRDD